MLINYNLRMKQNNHIFSNPFIHLLFLLLTIKAIQIFSQFQIVNRTNFLLNNLEETGIITTTNSRICLSILLLSMRTFQIIVTILITKIFRITMIQHLFLILSILIMITPNRITTRIKISYLKPQNNLKAQCKECPTFPIRPNPTTKMELLCISLRVKLKMILNLELEILLNI